MKKRVITATDDKLNGRQEVVNMPFYYFINKNNNRKDKRITNTISMPTCNRKAYLRASATVEASIIIPLYLYAVLAVVYVLQIISIRSTMLSGLYADIRLLAKYSYTGEMFKESGTNIVSIGLAKSLLIDSLPKNFSEKSRIIGKEAGISMLGTKMPGEDSLIILKVTYTVDNPFDIFGIGKVTIEQQCANVAWLGEDKVHNVKNNKQTDSLVYITSTGSVYHRDKFCRYLNPSVHGILFENIDNQRNLSGGKYYPCERCVRKKAAITVYITEYGNRYHTDIQCSGLKRTVFDVPISKVSDRRPCSKCGLTGG